MQTYLSQLLDDLAAAAKNPPAAHYYDAPPHLEEDRQLSELAMVPYRTIEQLSGIKQEMFSLKIDFKIPWLKDHMRSPIYWGLHQYPRGKQWPAASLLNASN